MGTVHPRALAIARILVARWIGTVSNRYPLFGMMVNIPGIVKNICTVPPARAQATPSPGGGPRGGEAVLGPLSV